MKHRKEHKLTFTLSGTTFKDPYSVIERIFSDSDIQSYRTFIIDILLYSSSEKHYQIERFGYIIYFLDRLSCLLEAGFAISKQRKFSLLDVRVEDILNRNFYSVRQNDEHIWSEFPRSLSQEEFLNPYRALAKVFRHRNPEEWSALLKEVTDYACGNYWGSFLEVNTLEVYQQLCKLLEAAHLIHVREIAQPDKWRRLDKGN